MRACRVSRARRPADLGPEKRPIFLNLRDGPSTVHCGVNELSLGSEMMERNGIVHVIVHRQTKSLAPERRSSDGGDLLDHPDVAAHEGCELKGDD